MKIFINELELDFTLEEENTVAEVLFAVQQELDAENGCIFGINIDGKDIGIEQISSLSFSNIEDTKEIKLDVLFYSQVIDSFKELLEPIKTLSNELENIPVYLQSADKAKVSLIFKNFADIFDKFCHVLSLISLFPEIYESKTIQGKPLQEFMKEFMPFLNDIQNALKENDTVLMGDLAEYEIKPRFDELAKFIESL